METFHIVYNFSDVESKVCAAYVIAKCNLDGIDYKLYNTDEYSKNELRGVLNDIVMSDDNTIYFAGYSFEEKIGESLVYNTYIIKELSEIGNVVWCDCVSAVLDDDRIDGYRDEHLHKFMCVEIFFENTTGILPYNIHKQCNIINGTLYDTYKEVIGYIKDYNYNEHILNGNCDCRYTR